MIFSYLIEIQHRNICIEAKEDDIKKKFKKEIVYFKIVTDFFAILVPFVPQVHKILRLKRVKRNPLIFGTGKFIMN